MRSPVGKLNPAWTAWGGFLLLTALDVFAGADLLANLGSYRSNPAPWADKVLFLRLASILFGTGLIVFLSVKRGILKRAAAQTRSFRSLLVLIPLLAAPVLLTGLAREQGVFARDWLLTNSFFTSLFFLSTALWFAALAFWPLRMNSPRKGIVRLLEAVAAGIVLLAVSAELILCLFSLGWYSERLWDPAPVTQTFDEFRKILGGAYLGFPFNSHGFYDHEFHRSREGEFSVAVVSGSFGLGVVPHAFNFTTTVEKELNRPPLGNGNRTVVLNFGVPCIRMPENWPVMRGLKQGFDPDLVVLCVFVGNDMFMLKSEQFRFQYYQNWRLYKFLRSFFRPVPPVGPPVREKGLEPGAGQGEPPPDYVLDQSKERPFMARERFLRMEKNRLGLCRSGALTTGLNFRLFFQALESMRGYAPDRFLLVLIPDEYQVNDELYALLTQGEPSRFDRESPQRLVAAYCEKNGIELLDLLPVLREAQLGGRTYHLQDTHWNAHGNKAAGLALAKRIYELTRRSEGRKMEKAP